VAIPARAIGIARKAALRTPLRIAGTLRQAAFDESMVEVRVALVRLELVGWTAVELGQAGHGGAISFLGPGCEPRQLHVADHLGA
jgi:hypothetical protein